MEKPSRAVHELTRRLMRVEAAKDPGASPPGAVARRVLEKLRIAVSRLAGEEGFSSLLRRALSLAQGEAPSLKGVQLNADGSLDGLDTLTATKGGSSAANDAAAIIANLLWLLLVFVGEPLMLRVVRGAWPNESF